MTRPVLLGSSALAGAGLVLAWTGCRTVRHGDDVAAITAVVRAQESAWNQGDVRGFMSAGYWNSPELTFYSGGDVTHGFEPVLARYEARYKTGDAEMGRLVFTDVEVLPQAEDVALVRGRWALDFERREDVAGLFTLVLRKSSAGWRIVHDHTSVAK